LKVSFMLGGFQYTSLSGITLFAFVIEMIPILVVLIICDLSGHAGVILARQGKRLMNEYHCPICSGYRNVARLPIGAGICVR